MRAWRRYTPPILAATAFVAAVALTLWSLELQRFGPELGVYGNLCGPTGDDLCWKPRLNAGWPLGYLYDVPGVSIEGAVALIEDQFRWPPFFANVLIYWAALFGTGMGLRAFSRRRSAGAA